MRLGDVFDWIERFSADRAIGNSIDRLESYLQVTGVKTDPEEVPIYFFNASTRIHRLSINAAISLISSWRLRFSGHPVKYLVCERGMQQCILGTNRHDLSQPPPCTYCVKFSRMIFPSELTIPLTIDAEVVEEVRSVVNPLGLEECSHWTYRGIPIGELCLPGIRWSLRRHGLEDTPDTRHLFQQYLISAASLATQLEGILSASPPKALVIFNGLTYPEAVARYIARSMGLPVFTHEVGLRPYSAFYSRQDATFREIDLPQEFQLTPEQNDRLDQYLAERFQGHTTMAGIQFWPKMESISEAIKEKMAAFDQCVSIFTNVIFDTSQVHANTIYPHMFAWLDDLVDVIDTHRTTLFILRAHPDEDRPGKESQESVSHWVESAGLRSRENVLFLSSGDSVSSYELARDSKFVLVYSSSIGLEASILGTPALCAGRARYTQLPVVYFPKNRELYLEQLNRFLQIATVPFPEHFRENARRVLYFELYRTSLDFAPFLQPYSRSAGMVKIADMEPKEMLDSLSLEIIENGILNGQEFEYPASQ